MASNPFVAAREQQLPSAVNTLPRELLETNAVPLMVLVDELAASSMIEIGVIQAVTGVDASNRQAIRTQRRILEDYRQRRLYDRDRTHCSNIDRIATQLRAPHEASGAQAKLDELDQVLGPLRHADDDLLDEVEQILDAAVETIRTMDKSSRLADVEAEQTRFAGNMTETIERIHANIREMHALRGRLIDLLASSTPH
jgi:hypothetical protein